MKQTIAATFALLLALASPALAEPLKIYILAGQSNMQGTGQLGTVPRMALSPESKALHDQILDEKGEPKVHENVSIVYFTNGDIKRGEPRPLVERKGLLQAGATGAIGPELGFGLTMDEKHDGPILIIKTAWGGKSLFHHFRPPSAGLREWEVPKNADKESLSDEMKKKRDDHYAGQGFYYKLMIKLVNEVLADPGKYCDAYDPKEGYEIAGFGWFQGFNDMITTPEIINSYTENMAHLIRDVRKDLKAPKLPFAIGIIGIGGADADGNQALLRKAQAAVAEIAEFKGNVVAVPTAPYWDHEVEEAVEKVSQSEALLENSEEWVVLGKPAPSERIWHYTSFDIPEDKQYVTHNKYSRSYQDTVPAELTDWLKPDFDTSEWNQGPAPIGKGPVPELKGKDAKPMEIPSEWGEGNTLVMKTTFNLEKEEITKVRLCLQSTASFHVYLNGERIHSYPWWKQLGIRKWVIEGADVKPGANELAFYGNILDRKGSSYNAVNLYLEGLPKDAAEKIAKQRNDIAPPKTHELAKGKSNQAFHYLGSAYTYCLIGEALAKGLMSLDQAGGQ